MYTWLRSFAISFFSYEWLLFATLQYTNNLKEIILWYSFFEIEYLDWGLTPGIECFIGPMFPCLHVSVPTERVGWRDGGHYTGYPNYQLASQHGAMQRLFMFYKTYRSRITLLWLTVNFNTMWWTKDSSNF